MLTERERGLIRALMYPVQFEHDPAVSIDLVLRYVVQEKSLNADTEEYFLAIKHALGSQEKLGELLPNAQEESVVRNYLEQVQAHLAPHSQAEQHTDKMYSGSENR